MLIDEVGLGIFLGIVLGAGYSIPILLLSLVYRYIANERLPLLMAVVLGVGLMGFAGGLSALPTLGHSARLRPRKSLSEAS